MTSKIAFCFDPQDFERVKNALDSAVSIHSETHSETTHSETQPNLPDLLLPNQFQIQNQIQNLTADSLPDLLAESDITVVFIGKHTFENELCLQMIDASFRRGNAFLAVYLNNADDVRKTGKELLGKNPLELFYFEYNGGITTLHQGAVVLPGKLKRRVSSKDMKAKADFVKVYDFIKDNGAENLEKWIEEERQRKADFWAECSKISETEWPSALKLTHKSGIVSFFLYYDWMTYSKEKE
ncbi:hypothetical protein MmiHf6_04390 [Methanimicrococcus hongohii]|uniref:Uncharacterized protein n=1 Tax=Methanimicrococcus hongohii TaxID=3028295 RepID=A0AA96ZTE7_9EURY|nr:TIR domain-containing protein [Methanimicrococcus sp. Hf6]WNY23136.1 hypothetical protein MmiHf6_04390 [Methanimicrococcus sp. Hf6]